MQAFGEYPHSRFEILETFKPERSIIACFFILETLQGVLSSTPSHSITNLSSTSKSTLNPAISTPQVTLCPNSLNAFATSFSKEFL